MSNDTHEEERPLLYTADFIELPLPTKKRGVFGFYRMADVPIKSRKDALAIWKPKTTKTSISVNESHSSLAAFIPRPVADQYIRPWDESDFERLGFTGEVPPLFRTKPRSPKVEDVMRDFLDSRPEQAEDDSRPSEDGSEHPEE
jgi:hypothetical protein